jgi:hypothetical protein
MPAEFSLVGCRMKCCASQLPCTPAGNPRTNNCTHEVKTDGKTHQVAVHVTFVAGDKGIAHVMTVGLPDTPLSAANDQTALQKDLDVFRQKHAELFESKIRTGKLAAALE